MSVQIGSNQFSPLAMAAQNKRQQPVTPVTAVQKTQADKAAELQTKRQQLQNEILLMRGTSPDSAELSTERLKNLQDELEEITAELRSPETPSIAETAESARAARPTRDWYEPEKADTSAPGIYSLERDEEKGWSISYAPYSEK